MEENQNPTPPVSEIPNPTPPVILSGVKDPKTPNPIKPVSKFSIKAIIGTIIFLLIAGGAAASFTVFKPQIMSLVSKPTLTPTVTIPPTPTPDPTADWKTYNNDFGKFSVKLPEGFKLATESSETVVNSVSQKAFTTVTIKLKDPSGVTFNVRIVENSNFSDNTDYQKFNLDVWKNNEKKDLIIDGLATFLVTGPDGMLEALWNTTASIFKNGKTFDITILSPEKLGNREQLFVQILSTFKFIDHTATPSPTLSGVQTPTPTCMPRPACLDATPRCMIPEPANGWCP
ncbi:MAG: hypothetical protein Q7T54_06475 [Candidatus Levybacteria bacterium]|nr:hypothetical protein [Candidatus Levybacteria bacterium]